ncbi:MAG: AhpC/TSA family protein [Bacteroidia bacterium]|nr:AhpC/TSA family protein [Bacteroidia bacterium]
MKTTSLLSLPVSLLLLSCGSSENNVPDAYTMVSGGLTNRGSDSIFLFDVNSQQAVKVAASFVDQDGKFSMGINVTEPGFYRLGSDERNFAMLVISPGEKISVTGDAQNLGYTYTIEGSPESGLFREINGYSMELSKRKSAIATKKDSIIQTYQYLVGKNNNQKYIDSLDKAMEPEFNRLDSALTPLIAEGIDKAKSFIESHPASFANLVAIGLLNQESDFPEFLKVYDQLKAKYPDNKNLSGFYTWIESKKKLAVGSEAPDFTLADPDGNPILLSQFRGKVTLVDFWASWCGPCRKENPNVVKVYQKYKDKGFEIFGVSLDDNKEKWLAAIAADGLAWKHGSELRGWNSAVCQMYNVQSIPFTLLLDKEGKIIASNLRGEALEQMIAKTLNP